MLMFKPIKFCNLFLIQTYLYSEKEIPIDKIFCQMITDFELQNLSKSV